MNTTHKETLVNKLISLGYNPDVIEIIIELSYKINSRNYSKSNEKYEGSYMTYDFLEDKFKHKSQNWPTLRKMIVGTIWICDNISSHGNKDVEKNKSYCYTLNDEYSILLGKYGYEKYRSPVDKDKRNDRFKYLNKKIKISLPPPPSHYLYSFRPPFLPPIDNSSKVLFLLDQLKSHNKLELTVETDNFVEEMMKQIEDLQDSEKKRKLNRKACHILYNLNAIKEGKINVEMLSPDGRWHGNGYIGLPADVRKTLTVNGKKLQKVIDIRSCHPSFFGLHLLNINKDCIDEVKKWNDIFLSKTIHPIKWLSNQLNIKLEDTVGYDGEVTKNGFKTIMNGFLNGYGRDKKGDLLSSHIDYISINKLDYWFKNNFPKMYATWKSTNIKQTGNNISRDYETKIMQDSSFLEKAKSLNINMLNEHDGCSLFADDDSNVNELMDFLVKICKEKFNLELVVVGKNPIDIKSKELVRSGDEHFLSDEELLMRKKNSISAYKNEVSKLGKRISGLCYKNFNSANKSWEKVNKLRSQHVEMKEKLKVMNLEFKKSMKI